MSVAQQGPIHVVPYDAKWPQQFEDEKKIIETALGADVWLVEHVGSTSVPGLIAKPKIDIVAVAGSRLQAIQALEGAGYTYQGEWNMPLKAAFTKRGEVDVNLHMFFELSHPEVELNLRFREALRKDKAACEAYAQLKRDLLADPTSQQIPGEFPLYTLRKGPFIESILRDIGYSRLRVLKANTDEQWRAVDQFRKQAAQLARVQREHAEHWILYRGVEIIGYAEIVKQQDGNSAFDVRTFAVEDATAPAESTAFFQGLIQQWTWIQKSTQ